MKIRIFCLEPRLLGVNCTENLVILGFEIRFFNGKNAECLLMLGFKISGILDVEVSDNCECRRDRCDDCAEDSFERMFVDNIVKCCGHGAIRRFWR